ncbi:MAG: hypothetical protein LBV65_02205 [Desulfovibrio sp.]|nr:hypothetical protein [Desulfovibrio sp.]
MNTHIYFDYTAMTLRLFDQRSLPLEKLWVECRTPDVGVLHPPYEQSIARALL